MGDFMNGKGTGEMIDIIQAEAMEEFVAHRDKYNPGWGWFPPDNRGDITNKFKNAKTWAEGRPNYFYKHIGDKWNLGTAIPLTINKENLDATITFNDITLSENIFDGKFFAGRNIQLSGVAEEEGKEVVGWKIDKDGSVSEETGATLNIEMPNCKKLAITPIIGLGGASGIREMALDGQNVKAIYNLQGVQQKALQKGVNIIVYGNGQSQKVLVK